MNQRKVQFEVQKMVSDSQVLNFQNSQGQCSDTFPGKASKSSQMEKLLKE
jgi:hypothetical protein